MGGKSSQASSGWSLVAIIDCMQDAASLTDDDVGFRDGTGSWPRSCLLRNGGLGVERPANDPALPAGRVAVVLPVRDGSLGGPYGTATEGHVLCPRRSCLFALRNRAAGRGWISRAASRPLRPTQGQLPRSPEAQLPSGLEGKDEASWAGTTSSA